MVFSNSVKRLGKFEKFYTLLAKRDAESLAISFGQHHVHQNWLGNKKIIQPNLNIHENKDT